MRPMLSSAVLIGSGSASERTPTAHEPLSTSHARTVSGMSNGHAKVPVTALVGPDRISGFIRVSRSRRTAAMLSTLNVIASVRKTSKAGVGVRLSGVVGLAPGED